MSGDCVGPDIHRVREDVDGGRHRRNEHVGHESLAELDDECAGGADVLEGQLLAGGLLVQGAEDVAEDLRAARPVARDAFDHEAGVAIPGPVEVSSTPLRSCCPMNAIGGPNTARIGA